MTEVYRSMSFGEYWRTYFPDLVEPLPYDTRRCILDKLYRAFLDEQYAGREVVQRLAEVYAGTITIDQYFAWATCENEVEGAEHLLAHLAAGEYVNDSRAQTLVVLGNIEYSPAFAALVRCAASDGVITPSELTEVLSRSLRNAPLPRVRDVPPHVPRLPFQRVMTPYEQACPHQRAPHAAAS